MADPTTTNKVAEAINKILKGLIEGAGEDAIIAAATAAQPWLGLPFVKQIFGLFVGYVAKFFYEQAAMAATKIVIDVQVEMEESKTFNAFQNLQMAIASGDPDAIKLASNNLDKAYGDLIHNDGWSSP